MELIQLQTAKDFSAYSEAITNNKNKNAEKRRHNDVWCREGGLSKYCSLEVHVPYESTVRLYEYIHRLS